MTSPAPLTARSGGRFAHGVLFAAAVLYVCLMIAFLAGPQELTSDARAFRSFVTTIVALAAPPIFLVLSAAIFGLAQLILPRTKLHGQWPYALWGGCAALLLIVLQIILPPRQSVWENIGTVAVVALVGGLSGLAFWAGAVRGLKSKGERRISLD